MALHQPRAAKRSKTTGHIVNRRCGKPIGRADFLSYLRRRSRRRALAEDVRCCRVETVHRRLVLAKRHNTIAAIVDDDARRLHIETVAAQLASQNIVLPLVFSPFSLAPPAAGCSRQSPALSRASACTPKRAIRPGRAFFEQNLSVVHLRRNLGCTTPSVTRPCAGFYPPTPGRRREMRQTPL